MRPHEFAHLALALTLVFCFLSVFLTFVSATRGLIDANTSGMSAGGALWFSDLTVADATGALPMLAVGLTYLNLERGMSSGRSEGMLFILKNTLQLLLIVGLPGAASLPQGVHVYWITSGIFTMAQTTLLRQQSVRSGITRSLSS